MSEELIKHLPNGQWVLEKADIQGPTFNKPLTMQSKSNAKQAKDPLMDTIDMVGPLDHNDPNYEGKLRD